MSFRKFLNEGNLANDTKKQWKTFGNKLVKFTNVYEDLSVGDLIFQADDKDFNWVIKVVKLPNEKDNDKADVKNGDGYVKAKMLFAYDPNEDEDGNDVGKTGNYFVKPQSRETLTRIIKK
jgi:hypothetical protein